VFDVVEYPLENWTSPALSEGALYFAVRAATFKGEEEQNTNVVAAGAYNRLPQMAAVITSPENGRSISGNRLTITANLLKPAEQQGEIAFEYTQAGSDSWNLLGSASVAAKSKSPIILNTDIGALAEGTYHLRAVALTENNIREPLPGFITITVNHAVPEIIEQCFSTGEQSLSTHITAEKTAVITAAYAGKQEYTQITIPRKSLTAPETDVTVTINPKGIIPPDDSVVSLNTFREITLKGAQLDGTATLSIPFEDTNNDGIVDGTVLPVKEIAVFAYNATDNVWEQLPTAIDACNHSAIAKTTHFSLFGLFIPAIK
jgi:hypothetical protein